MSSGAPLGAGAFGDRLAAVLADVGGLCLGIDPHAPLLADWGLPDSAIGVREFGLRAVDAAASASASLGIVKPQVAFFERHGAAGYAALETVLAAARSAGLVVIADAKRGDMGSTFDAYAEAWFTPGSPLEADALTVNPYLGTGVLQRAFDLAAQHAKGMFVLSATSNPDASSVQTAHVADGASVAAAILEDMERRNAGTGAALGPFGVVIGATNVVADFGLDLATAPRTPILGPGYGAQGARLADTRRIYGPAAPRVVASVSRDALAAGPIGLPARLRELADELRVGVGA